MSAAVEAARGGDGMIQTGEGTLNAFARSVKSSELHVRVSAGGDHDFAMHQSPILDVGVKVIASESDWGTKKNMI